MNFASLFTANIVGESLNHFIERDAAQGRVNGQLSLLLNTAYGIELPAAPAKAIALINTYAAHPTRIVWASGEGAHATAEAVMQTLHYLGTLLHASPAKGLPALLPVPAWADPETIAKAKKVAAEKRAAKKAAKAVAEANAKTEDVAPVSVPALPEVGEAPVDLGSAINVVLAAAKSNMLTEAQALALRAALEVTMPIVPVPAKARRQGTKAADRARREPSAVSVPSIQQVEAELSARATAIAQEAASKATSAAAAGLTMPNLPTVAPAFADGLQPA